MFNWFSQIISVTHVNLRSIPERRGAVLAAAVGIAGVVTVFIGVLSIAEGFRAAMKAGGSPDVAIVLRSGADTEMTSGLGRDEARLIDDAPGIARNTVGPLTSAELFVIINLPKRSTGTDANVPFRGAGPAAMAVRGDIRIIEGRTSRSGPQRSHRGRRCCSRVRGFGRWQENPHWTKRLGSRRNFYGRRRRAESEIWTDAAVLQPAYHRGNSFQSVYAKLSSPAPSTNSRTRSRLIRN